MAAQRDTQVAQVAKVGWTPLLLLLNSAQRPEFNAASLGKLVLGKAAMSPPMSELCPHAGAGNPSRSHDHGPYRLLLRDE